MPSYLKRAGAWQNLGGGSSSGGGGGSTVVDRSALVSMVDRPDKAGNSGLTGKIAVQDMIDIVGTGTVPKHTNTSTALLEGRIIWGIAAWTVGAKYNDCIFAGPNPSTWSEGVAGNPSYGCTQNYGTAPVVADITNCLYDPSLWLTARAPGGAQPKLNRYNIGHHGGNARIKYCEFKNISDGVNFIGPNGSLAAANAGEFLLEQSWLHKCLYGNDLYPPDDGQPHCDGFQMNYGKNVTLRGNVIGGTRDPVGYCTWPGGYNSGDDFWNSGIILKQERSASSEDIGRCENILIEGNWIGGGGASINHTSSGDYTGSWANTVIRNNRFMRRGPGWEQYMKPTKGSDGKYIPHSAPVPTYGPGSPNYGFYILRPAALDSIYSGNVIDDTGAAAPKTNS